MEAAMWSASAGIAEAFPHLRWDAVTGRLRSQPTRGSRLWRNADPELQPQIVEVKRRLAGVMAEPP